jgi:hypothetical protein
MVTKLVWDTIGERYYENGVSNGVLFIDDSGYAWSGLLSVAASPSGGEPRPYYIDGQKYRNLATAEEFEATLTAVSAPPEFSECDGLRSIQNGLFAAQQRRKSFDLSYQTRISSDTDEDLGYKIHIVYNALASPTEREYQSLGDSPALTELSWKITTVPAASNIPATFGIRPTAYFVVDSRYTPEPVLSLLEETLYGTDLSPSYIPVVGDLMDMFDV